MHVTIDGTPGGVTPSTAEDAVNLALMLLQAGYSPRINGLRVTLNFGPGYNYVTWAEGDFANQNVSDTLQHASR